MTTGVWNGYRLKFQSPRHAKVVPNQNTTESTVEIPIDSGIGLSTTIDKIRVFINKTLSTESLINQLLIRGLSYQLLLIVGKFGKVWGHVSVKTTIYMLVGVSDNDKCVSVTQW